MKQTITITINNAQIIDGKIEIEITPEMARKVLEESDEIQVGEEYYYRISNSNFCKIAWNDVQDDNYRKEQDNCLPCKSYTEQQAKEYFDKRDARRAAEYRIKKAIEKMNEGKEECSQIVYEHDTGNLEVRPVHAVFGVQPIGFQFNHSIDDYMLKHHTEDYKIYWGIELYENGINTLIGMFDDEIDAAKAYDAKARELFGDFAKLNF